MEEESTAVQEEETSAPSASETESVSEVETSTADTLDQPTEETTAEESKSSRAQERIRKLAAERDYWKDLAPAPVKEEDAEEEVTVQGVAKQSAQEVLAQLDMREAKKQMVEDALAAEEKYPQLADDEDLATDVIALARGRGISISAAADRVIGRQTSQLAAAKGKAEQSLKAPASTPQGKKVTTGEAPQLDISSMSESQKEANWSQIINNIANQ